MVLTLDGYEVLRRIGTHAGAFAAVKGDVAKTAEALVKKQIKSKGIDLAGFRALVSAVGHDTVALILETCSAGEIRGLVKKFDPYHALNTGDGASAKRHLLALADARAKPAIKSLTAKVRPGGRFDAVPKVKTASPFGTRAMGAKREI